MPSWLEGTPADELDAGPVLLRRWRLADAEVLNRVVTDNYYHLHPWMPWAQSHPSIGDQLMFLGRAQEAWAERTDFGYAVTLPNAQIVGGMGLHTRQGAGTLEIGYWIGLAHTSHGYATAGSAALMEAAFALPGVEWVEIRCDEANHASAAVPSKLGFKLVEVIARDPDTPAATGRGMIWAIGRMEHEAGRLARTGL
jgi:RimJ/RimL family protein N-acetyltransferase